MSEDSPTGGQEPSSELNSSIIGKVRSRVSRFLPATLGRWFSQSSTEASRNGTVSKRKNSNYSADSSGVDDSHSGDNEHVNPVVLPTKRPRTESKTHHFVENYQILDRYSALANAKSEPRYRQHMIAHANKLATPYNFNRSEIAASNSYAQIQTNLDLTEHETEKSRQHRGIRWDNKKNISSRRILNIPPLSSSTTNRCLPDYLQQPFKNPRSRLNSPQLFGSNVHIDESEETEESDLEDKTEGNFIDSQKRMPTGFTNGVGTSSGIVLQVDDASDSDDSQCSSLHTSKNPGMLSSTSKALESRDEFSFYSHLEGKKSLFSKNNMPNNLNNSTMSLTSLHRRQSVKTSSLYGSMSALSDSRLMNTMSPFYKGRTTFGGASAYNSYQPSQRTLRIPTIMRPTSALSSNSSFNNSLGQSSDISPVISDTAKRILDLMENFTSPLIEAKKMASSMKVPALIAHKERFGRNELLANRAIRLSSPKVPDGKLTSIESIPPATELRVPSISQKLRIKRLQESTERVREIACSSNSILNREQSYKLPDQLQNNDEHSSTHVNKIKNRITRVNKKSNFDVTETTPEVNLPEIALPEMKSVPKIDIFVSGASTLMESTSQKIGFFKATNNDQPHSESSSSRIKTKRSSIYSTSTIFPFSCPIDVHVSGNNNIESSGTFEFSKPIFIGKLPSVEEDLHKNDKSTSNVNFSMTVPTSESLQSENINCLSKKDVLNKKEPMEIQNDKSQQSNIKPPLSILFNSNKWECMVCLVRNDSSTEICVACSSPKSSPASSASTSQVSSEHSMASINTFGDKFKPKPNTWECSSCLLRNNEDLGKCIACNSSKPTRNSQFAPAAKMPKPLSTGFQEIVTEQATKWKCPCCMSLNSANRTKCACCEQDNPALRETDSAPKFAFTGTSFTFGFGSQKEEDLRKECKQKTVTPAVSTELQKADGSNSQTFVFGATTTTKSLTEPNAPFSYGFKKLSESKAGKDVVDLASDSLRSDAESVNQPDDLKSKETKPNSTDEKDKIAVQRSSENPTGGFRFEREQSTSKVTKEVNAQEPNSLKSSGGFKFNWPSANTNDARGSSTTNQLSKPAFDTFGNGNSTTDLHKCSSIQSEGHTVEKADSTAEIKPVFKFGEPINLGVKLDSSPKDSALSVFASPTQNSLKDNSSTTFGSQVTSSPASSSTGTFVFGKTSAAPTNTPFLFGAAASTSSTTCTSTVASTSSSFGQSSSNDTKPIFGSSVKSIVSVPTADFVGSTEKQASTFANSFSASINNTSQQKGQQSTTLFGFGTIPVKKSASESVFENVSSTTNKPSAIKSSVTSTNTSTQFVFGANPAKPTIFGLSTSGNNSDSALTTQIPTFGSFSSSAAAPFATANVPVFGSVSSTGSTFSGSSTSTFGGSTSTFGVAPNSTFGNSSAAVFGSGFGTDTPVAKKSEPFAFGSSSNAPYQFGGASKPSFNFSATSPSPSFNFTGSQEFPTKSSITVGSIAGSTKDEADYTTNATTSGKQLGLWLKTSRDIYNKTTTCKGGLTTTTEISFQQLENDHKEDLSEHIWIDKQQKDQTVRNDSSQNNVDQAANMITATRTALQCKPRKHLISLRNKKNRQSNKILNNDNTTQRKLNVLNNMYTNLNRYKYVRRISDAPDSSEPNLSSADERQQSGHPNLRLITKFDKKSLNSNLITKSKTLAYKIKRKYDPSKFKYVKPN